MVVISIISEPNDGDALLQP